MSDKCTSNANLLNADDSELVTEFRNGNRDAFDVLWKRHQQKIVGNIYRIVKCHNSTEEVCQDTAISAIMTLRASTKPINDIVGFLIVIGRRRAHEYLRRLIRHRRCQPVSLSPYHDVAVDNSHSDFYERIDHASRVILASLPPEDRLLIEQFHFESLSRKQIAHVRGKTRSRIGQRLREIHSRLRQHLEIVSQ